MFVMILGKRQQGKSTLSFVLATEAHDRVLIFDPSGNFPLVKRIRTEDVGEWLVSHREPEPGVSNHYARVSGNWKTSEMPAEFEAFSEQIFHDDIFEHNLSVIVDEAHILQGPNYVDPCLDRMQRKIPADSTLIETTHRIVDTDVNTRYHVNVFFFFYTDLPREIKKYREDFGDVAEAIQKLKPHEVIEWKRPQGNAPEWEVWDNPEEWYIDLKNENKLVQV